MWLRVSALLMRHLYLYRRSHIRVGEVFFWPVMNLLLWGFITAYLQRLVIPEAVGFLLGGLIFWDCVVSCTDGDYAIGHGRGLGKNLLNLFIAPIRIIDFLLATCLIGVIRAMVNLVLLGGLAYILYAFNLLTIGLALLPFLTSLLLFGWGVGMCTMALMLRFGQAAEALAWSVPFLLQPLSAVFYPVDVLPQWLQDRSRLFHPCISSKAWYGSPHWQRGLVSLVGGLCAEHRISRDWRRIFWLDVAVQARATEAI